MIHCPDIVPHVLTHLLFSQQEEEFAQEILHLVMKTALISLEDADFLANMFGDKLSEVAQPPRYGNHHFLS